MKNKKYKKYKKYILATIVGLILILAIVIRSFYFESQEEREMDAYVLLSQERNVLEEYAYQFVQLKKIVEFVMNDDVVKFRYYKNNKSAQLETLVLNLTEKKYYIEGTGKHYDSLQQALTFLEISRDEMTYWMEVLQKYKLYEIGADSKNIYVKFIFNRSHLIPNGLIYVFRCEDQEKFVWEIPGRSRGKESAKFNIMTYFGTQWFYFEGP